MCRAGQEGSTRAAGGRHCMRDEKSVTKDERIGADQAARLAHVLPLMMNSQPPPQLESIHVRSLDQTAVQPDPASPKRRSNALSGSNMGSA